VTCLFEIGGRCVNVLKISTTCIFCCLFSKYTTLPVSMYDSTEKASERSKIFYARGGGFAVYSTDSFRPLAHTCESVLNKIGSCSLDCYSTPVSLDEASLEWCCDCRSYVSTGGGVLKVRPGEMISRRV
jgi:hypothetical protein